MAHNALSEDAFDLEAHPDLELIGHEVSTILLAAERFRPALSPTLRAVLGRSHDELEDGLNDRRPAFRFSEESFATSAEEQLAGRPFSDLGPRRTLGFSALGTTWQVSCANDRQSVLAAERFTAAAQILLVEFAFNDPLFLTQDVHVEVAVAPPSPRCSAVRFKPDNDAVSCTLTLSPATAPGEDINREVASALVYLMAHLTLSQPA